MKRSDKAKFFRQGFLTRTPPGTRRILDEEAQRNFLLSVSQKTEKEALTARSTLMELGKRVKEAFPDSANPKAAGASRLAHWKPHPEMRLHITKRRVAVRSVAVEIGCSVTSVGYFTLALTWSPKHGYEARFKSSDNVIRHFAQEGAWIAQDREGLYRYGRDVLQLSADSPEAVEAAAQRVVEYLTKLTQRLERIFIDPDDAVTAERARIADGLLAETIEAVRTYRGEIAELIRKGEFVNPENNDEN